MSDDLLSPSSPPDSRAAVRAEQTLGASTLYRLCEEVIALRERTQREHKMFEQALAKARDTMQASFNSFAGDTQRAYQQLRQEIHGEKRVSVALLNELLEVGQDLQHIVAARPGPGADAETLAAWANSVEVESRKVQAAILRHGVHPYNAAIGSPYNPALHERVGSKRVDGMDALRVAEQVEPGQASAQPEFVLRRVKVIVTE